MNFNGKETIGFDKIKVKCYNCHRRGYFAKECRAPRSQGNRNGDAPRRNAPVDTSTTNALVQDGIGGYDWSFQAKEGFTNFALMTYTPQGSSSSDSEIILFNPIACCTASSRLEVQRSSRYGSMIIIIIAAAWSKVTAARVESSYYCCKGTFVFFAANGISTASFEYYYCQGKWSKLITSIDERMIGYLTAACLWN
ncbi:ribonuclease H-like domain-containing protein [Tanacetum coccineum]|uniref:Ribonuclease H-like domain-containing protein n=1 Tax=Tanacetum coccineum TaxID=301880 RepID=A0ABQ5C2K6_9ASTR